MESFDSTDFQPARIGSSHGTIRGGRVQLNGGSRGHGIGRLGVTSSGENSFSTDLYGQEESARPSSNRGGRNYFGSVGAGKQTGDTAVSSPKASGPSDVEQTWSRETYKSRLTLSKSLSQKGARQSVEDPALGQDVAGSSDELQRRMSLLAAQHLTRRSSVMAGQADRSKALTQKQDLIRSGSFLGGDGTSSVRSSSFVGVLPVGQSGFQSRPTTSSAHPGPSSPTAPQGRPIPQNPLANRAIGATKLIDAGAAPQPASDQRRQSVSAQNPKEVQSGGCCC